MPKKDCWEATVRTTSCKHWIGLCSLLKTTSMRTHVLFCHQYEAGRRHCLNFRRPRGRLSPSAVRRSSRLFRSQVPIILSSCFPLLRSRSAKLEGALVPLQFGFRRVSSWALLLSSFILSPFAYKSSAHRSTYLFCCCRTSSRPACPLIPLPFSLFIPRNQSQVWTRRP